MKMNNYSRIFSQNYSQIFSGILSNLLLNTGRSKIIFLANHVGGNNVFKTNLIQSLYNFRVWKFFLRYMERRLRDIYKAWEATSHNNAIKKGA